MQICCRSKNDDRINRSTSIDGPSLPGKWRLAGPDVPLRNGTDRRKQCNATLSWGGGKLEAHPVRLGVGTKHYLGGSVKSGPPSHCSNHRQYSPRSAPSQRPLVRQHALKRLPDPHGHGSRRPNFSISSTSPPAHRAPGPLGRALHVRLGRRTLPTLGGDLESTAGPGVV